MLQIRPIAADASSKSRKAQSKPGLAAQTREWIARLYAIADPGPITRSQICGAASRGAADSAGSNCRRHRERNEEFFVGDTVSFPGKHLSERVGIIARFDAKTACIAANDSEGHWQVSYALLRKFVDI